MSYTLKNNVSSAPFNCNVGYNNSWIHVDNNAGRELFAQASYITNLSDINISLSASDLDIGSVHILDSDTGLKADVVPVGIGIGALRVISQDLESSEDDVTIGDRLGNFASVYAPLSALKVYNTNPVTQITTSQEPTQLDAFGRLRISSPITLFDSSHRYRDNNLWSTLSANGGSVSFNPSQGLIELNVTNTAGASAIRETTKVFSYQPGKSLLVMNTFVMASSATNLRQRVGYFGDQNGIYFQLDDGNISMVERSLVTGSVTESVVSRSNWNGDKLDGTGSSGIVLNITKAQILWMDIEWLGLGTVRVGFIIN